MIVFYIIIILCFSDKGTSLKGFHVCHDPDRNIEYCCSNYEEINGICTECKVGFTSIRGLSCKPCWNNRYGKYCLSRCACISQQRCDRVIGCVLKDVTTEHVSPSTDTIQGKIFETSTEHVSPSTDTVHRKFFETLTELKFELLIYSSAVTCIIVIIGGILVYKRFKKKRQISNMGIINHGVRLQNVLVKESHAVSEENEEAHVYHTIDDEKFTDENLTDGTYLDVVDGSNISGSVYSGNEEESCHVRPYNNLVHTVGYVHQYEKIQPIYMNCQK